MHALMIVEIDTYVNKRLSKNFHTYHIVATTAWCNVIDKTSHLLYYRVD